ncbi:MAG: 30S ribosomal protein S9 [Candidatus Pacearchaeota archaeon]
METKINNLIITSGKRKEAVARAMIKAGNGKIKFNGKSYKLLHVFDRLRIEEPLKIYEKIIGEINFDVDVTARSGGANGQIEAARIALSRGMVEFADISGKGKELSKAFLIYDRNLLVADVRRKEAYKPGDSKARRHRQSSYR